MYCKSHLGLARSALLTKTIYSNPLITIQTSNPCRAFRVRKDVLLQYRHFCALFAAKPRSLLIHEPNIAPEDLDIIVDFLNSRCINWSKLQRSNHKTWRLGTLCVAAHKLQLTTMFTALVSALLSRATKTDGGSFLRAVEHVYKHHAATAEFRAAFREKAATMLAPSSQESPTWLRDLLLKGGPLAQDMYHARGVGARQRSKDLETRIAQLEAHIVQLEAGAWWQPAPWADRARFPMHGARQRAPMANAPRRPAAGRGHSIWDV